MNGPGRPSVITPATDHQLLLTDDGNGALSALGPSPGNEGSACKPSNYADILIPSTAMITVGARYPDIQGDGLSGRPTEHCLDDSAHSQLEFMILIDF